MAGISSIKKGVSTLMTIYDNSLPGDDSRV
jgi:hypothetical protein